LNLFNDETTVTSLYEVNKYSVEYIFDLPNTVLGPKMSRKCMARRSSRHDHKENESFKFKYSSHILLSMYYIYHV